LSSEPVFYHFPQPFHQDFFKYLDVLVYVESTIYQLDEDNELLAKSGTIAQGRHLLGEFACMRTVG